MPSVSSRQRRFMGAELARERAGKSTQTHMTDKQLADFARKPKHKKHKRKTKHKRKSSRKS